MPKRPPTEIASSSSSGPASFLSLPAELRNEIYSLVAVNTRLVHNSNRGGRYRGPGLLLTSRQVRKEYGAFLWSLARITVLVQGFDFRIVQSMTGSLYSKQLRALRQNNCLVLRLVLQRQCDRRQWEQLRRWLVQRTNNIDLLPWSYELAFSPSDMSASARVQCLEAHENLINDMVAKGVLDEPSQFELYPIISRIEHEAERSRMIAVQLDSMVRMS